MRDPDVPCPHAQDLVRFIDAAPTPYHAVAEVAARLEAVGYEPLPEGDVWDLEEGDRHYVVRSDGSIVAFEMGSEAPADAGFRILGAHTDSPNLRIKPNPEWMEGGQRRWRAQPYGGVLLYTWFDRDCGIAGRVSLRSEAGVLTTRLLRLDGPDGRGLVRVPSLAIHLNREIRTDGFKPNAETHMIPLVGSTDTPSLREVLVEALQNQHALAVDPTDILGWDLMLFDVQPASLGGVHGEYVQAPRLDNLASCHAATTALASQKTPAPFTRVVALWDHEEVGSQSAHGAAGSLLGDVLGRLAGDGEALARAVSRSFQISADMAHAQHPNYGERSEMAHAPRLGAGPVVKVNPNQRYATDAATVGFFRALCDEIDVPTQTFVNRADLGCGTTIGPIASARLGVRTVDVGGPMLAMHSCREMAATADVAPMIRAMERFHARV